MANNKAFFEASEKYLYTLKQYVPVVAKVHGKQHPEFFDVQKLFDMLAEKIKESGAITPELSKEFEKLRTITNNYSVPDDVCESYEAVYSMLAELDRAYKAKQAAANTHKQKRYGKKVIKCKGLYLAEKTI